MTPEFEKIMELINNPKVKITMCDYGDYLIGKKIHLMPFKQTNLLDPMDKGEILFDLRFKGNFMLSFDAEDSRVITNAINTRQVETSHNEFLAYDPTKE